MISRRTLIKAAAAFPVIVPASVFGRNAPSNRINVGAIGVGRISRIHDMPSVWRHDDAHIVAVCDLDSRRALAGQQLVDRTYAGKTGQSYRGTRAYLDYRQLLANRDVDAVLISTPDHQHARLAIHAVRAGFVGVEGGPPLSELRPKTSRNNATDEFLPFARHIHL